MLISDIKEIFFPLNSQAFLVNSVARTWVSGIFSCLSNSQIPSIENPVFFVEFSGLAPFCDNAWTVRHINLQLVDNLILVRFNSLLDYQFRGHRFDPQLLWCFGIGFKPRIISFGPVCCWDIKFEFIYSLNPIACRKAKIVYNFGSSECSRVKLNSKIK